MTSRCRSSSATRTLSRLRMKSYGTSSSFRQPDRSKRRWVRIASSIGLAKPVSKNGVEVGVAAAPSRSPAPSTSSAEWTRTTPSVSVPVLSEQSTFMLPKFSIEARRLTITFACRHALGAVGQVDADDRRQQLRRQADGQRQREEEGLEDRAVEVDVDREDGDDQHQRDLHQEVAEAPDAAFELGLRRPEPAAARRPCRTRSPSRCGRRRPWRVPLTTCVPMKSVLVRWPSGVVRRGSVAGCLRDRIGLAGQGRFVDEQVLRLQDQAVAGRCSAGGQDDDVARARSPRPGSPSRAPSRSAVGLRLHDGEQLLDRVGRPALLPESEQAAGQDDRQDDRGVDRVVQEEGQPGGEAGGSG